MISQFMSHAQEDRHSKRTKVICVPMTAQDITEMRSLSTMQARPVVSCIPDDEQRVGRVCSRPQSCKRSSWVCQRWSAGKIWSPWQWRTRANETEEMMMQSQKSVEPHRSQGARMFFLGTPTLWTGDTGHLHLISYASKWSAFQAETYSLQPEIEEGDRIRAAVADVYGKLERKDWESTSAAFLRQIWFTDCRSTKETLLNPKATSHGDKRLSIEIASLRQSLWRSKVTWPEVHTCRMNHQKNRQTRYDGLTRTSWLPIRWQSWWKVKNWFTHWKPTIGTFNSPIIQFGSNEQNNWNAERPNIPGSTTSRKYLQLRTTLVK